MASLVQIKKRCRPLRRESDDCPWFVTTRVIEERFWLHPILSCGAKPVNREARRACAHLERHSDKRLAQFVKRTNARRRPNEVEMTLEYARVIVRDLVGSALARAQERYGAQVFGLVVMSNHLHLVCQTRGKNLAKFVGYLKARIADAINMITGKRGPLWARRYDAQPILDDAACAERVGYTANNPRAANLVDDPQLWPGLSLAYGTTEEQELTFTYFDRTAWQRAKRPNDIGPFMKQATLVLSPIPSCEGMSPELYRQSLQTWIDDAQDKHQAKSGQTDAEGAALARRHPSKALGIDGVVRASVEQRPRSPSFSRRPYAFGTPEAVRAHRHAMFAVMAEYDQCGDRYRSGEWHVGFPEGTYRPPMMQAA